MLLMSVYIIYAIVQALLVVRILPNPNEETMGQLNEYGYKYDPVGAVLGSILLAPVVTLCLLGFGGYKLIRMIVAK